LANDRYEEALESFMKSGHWRDASYVAEQLLSCEELLVYVRNRWASHESSVSGVENQFPYLLRYLTARRLARDHYFKDARPLLPPELVPVFDQYVEKYRLFRDESKPESDRAAAGWVVAQIYRRLGMELFGTEVGPDYTCWGGNYEGTERSWDRLKLEEYSRRAEKVSHYRNPIQPKSEGGNQWWKEQSFAAKVFPEPTATEQWRWRKYAKLPSMYRFHYRHVAADLAWEAAMLMSVESEETARVYNIAGSWLEGKRPQEADVFYKAMIRRNWSTPTARRADERRWFISHDWRSDFDPWQSLGLPRPVRLDFWNPKESVE
jgi:hypothetical protein